MAVCKNIAFNHSYFIFFHTIIVLDFLYLSVKWQCAVCFHFLREKFMVMPSFWVPYEVNSSSYHSTVVPVGINWL